VSRLTAYIADHILAQRGHLFPWSAVIYGAGVGAFFALRYEPDLLLRGVGMAGVITLASAVISPPMFRPIFWALTLFCAGFVVAEWRSSKVSAPILGFRYYGAVEGRIIAIDRSASDALRLTLDQVVLDDVQVARLPERVRVSLHGDQQHFHPEPGDVVAMAAHLSPPSGPVEPGGFDFQRHAWFLRLGAVGFTNTPVMVIETGDAALPIFRLRVKLSTAIQNRIAGDAGAFASAVMTGDRSAMGQDVLAQLRATNLAHLLAISGLHMGFLAGAVFAAIRCGFALLPSISARLPAKKISAVGALMAATFYLALSGGAVATERAYVMIAVALVATLLDRRAISLRAVAVAALIVLTLSPEALLSPGFQMSFAATTALVAVFAFLRDAEWTLGPKWLRPAVVLLISSTVAGASTGPYSAAHFNQIAQWGLLANLLSVPVMGTLVIPGAVLAAVLTPFGGEAIGLWFASWGLR
jgi:competence protein ComEC